MDSDSPCKDLLFPQGPNLAQKSLYLVGAVVNDGEFPVSYPVFNVKLNRKALKTISWLSFLGGLVTGKRMSNLL